MELKKLVEWDQVRDTPIAIAGPCSAETEDQLYNTCKKIKELDISVLRAGIWKPRTRPNSFEGVGEVGLGWFRDIKKDLNMPAAVEVATPEHVELALKYNMDILWIGARTTVNPFSVQAIADALKGVDIPVIIKNPINPDVALWLGAIERIYNSGITKIAALHRGFSSFGQSKYRNEPMWQIPIALKSEIPSLPMLCDPSHICGNRDGLFAISQRALDLNFEGLMIETHVDPANAWSDAAQQITPERLGEMLSELKIRKSTIDESEVNELNQLRIKIDQVDRELLEAVASRMALVEKIGAYKKERNLAVFQVERWLDVFKSRPDWGKQLNLNPEFVALLYKQIHDESIRIQSDIVDE